MHAQSPSYIMLTDSGCHQQQRFTSLCHTFFGFRRANRRFYRQPLFFG